MMVKVREDRSVQNRACYLAIGVTCDGDREVLGIWWQETEGAKFWLAVLNDLQPPRRRGRPDLLRRRPQGLPRGDRGDVPAGLGADLHRAPDPRLAALRQLPRPQEGRRRAAARSTPPPTPTPPLAELDASTPSGAQRYPPIAAAPGARAGSTSSRSSSLPDELRQAVYTTNTHRGPAPPDPQGDQDPRALPRRTSRHQADLPRDHPSRRQVATQPHLDSTPAQPSRSTSETDSPANHPPTSRHGLTHRTIGQSPTTSTSTTTRLMRRPGAPRCSSTT